MYLCNVSNFKTSTENLGAEIKSGGFSSAIAVVPPHCFGYCYTTIRYGKIYEERGDDVGNIVVVTQGRQAGRGRASSSSSNSAREGGGGRSGNANGSSAPKIQRRGNSIVQHQRDFQKRI